MYTSDWLHEGDPTSDENVTGMNYHHRCWFVDRPFLRQCPGTPHGERPRLKLSPLAAANHRYGLLVPEREAEGEGPLASSVALLLRVATGERDATRGSPLLSCPRWRRRVTPEATIAADSELTKRRPSRCRSLEEKKQGVDRGASSSYATAAAWRTYVARRTATPRRAHHRPPLVLLCLLPP
nr:hypothetical protein Iba_scaffold13864CG0020 [Ipomoea batatas]GME16686.1 hypothetical protein Iba_scaffold17841CG0010 [Ipomoea batatas]